MKTNITTQITPRTKVSIPYEYGVFGFLRNKINERLILGIKRGEQVPVKVSLVGSEPDYILVNEKEFKDFIFRHKSHIDTNVKLSKTDENIMRLWACPALWNLDKSNKISLKPNLRILVIFDFNGYITKVTDDEESIKKIRLDQLWVDFYAELKKSTDKNELEITSFNFSPQEFPEQVRILNQLISQLS